MRCARLDARRGIGRAGAAYADTILTAFEEVENALTNERLLAELKDRTDAVRIAKVQYKAGTVDLLLVLQL